MNVRRSISGAGSAVTTIIATICVAAITGCTGCYFGQEKYERTEHLESPLAAAGQFAAQTHNGAITVAGVDEPICRVSARIIGYAPKIEDAKRLAEQVRVSLVARDGGLATRVEKPHIPMRCGLCVEFDVSLPRQTSLDLETHNGAIRIADIAGDAKAVTHNGDMRVDRLTGNANLETYNGAVRAETVTGRLELKTHNGEIVCRQIAGPLNATTHNGQVEVVCGESAGPPLDARITTHNGDITFVAPPNLSAKTTLRTHNGSVKTAIPITVQGEISKSRLTGTAGSGEGTLHLETHNGSISLR